MHCLQLTGSFITLNTHDPRTATRSYAVTAYYLPSKDRPNLTVLPGAHVARVLSHTDTDGTLTVTGVEFIHGKKMHVVHVNQEAVLCAG